MMERLSPTSSIAVLHLSPASQRAWPAIRPWFTFRGGQPSFAPPGPELHATERRGAAHEGQAAFAELTQLRRAATLPAWQIDLAEAAAHLKCGADAEALARLLPLQNDTALQASLPSEPQGRPFVSLTDVHWLWSLAHVAVESGQAETILPTLWLLGLGTQATRNPMLADQLLVNAMQQENLAALQWLHQAGLTLLPQRAQNFFREVEQRSDVYVARKRQASRHRHESTGEALAHLRKAAQMLDLPLASFAQYDAFEAAQTARTTSLGGWFLRALGHLGLHNR